MEGEREGARERIEDGESKNGEGRGGRIEREGEGGWRSLEEVYRMGKEGKGIGIG